MNAQFLKGVLPICILDKVRSRDMYGYEVVKYINEEIEVNEGTVYPVLRRLAKEGYFETYMVESVGGPARKYYKITDFGKKELDVMKKEWFDFTKSINKILEG